MTKARDIATSSITSADLTAEVGSTIQAHDADLDTISGLAKTDGNVIVGDGTNWVAEDPATVRTSLGLGTAATTAATDYATAAQGATADSALQSADIGSTVQAYDADTAKLDAVQTFTANQTFADGVRAYFGTGPDFSIFHDSNNTYLTEVGDGTGNTYLRANNLQLLNNANEIYVNCTSDGTVGLYHDNAIRLGTTSTGVSITGTVDATAFTGDGSGLTGLGGGGFSNMQVFNSPGTWTNPGSVTKVKVTVTGGGGAGVKPVASAYGPGAGAGGSSIEVLTIPTSPVPVTRGAGGTGSGGAGGTSSFGAYCSATGGGPGVTGGAGSGGSINFGGGYGGNTLPTPYPGQGGNSIYGGGGAAGPDATGRNGQAYGAGGAGGNQSQPSGAGSAGVVIVEW